MKKLEKEITALCDFHHPKKSFQNDIRGDFLYNDDSRYSFQNYDRGTISESYLEEENVVGFEEEIKELPEFVVEATLSEEELRSRLTKLLNANNNKHLIVIEDLEETSSLVVLLGGLLSVKERSHDDCLKVIERALYQWWRYLGSNLSRSPFTAPEDLGEKAPEDLGEMYLKELVYRNMIQVRWKLDGSPKTCRIANSVYDVFCQKAADVKIPKPSAPVI
ncbi:hypothetical protein Patl1_26296 [Pistacia atlantica]|uniref:Uncharacterized protein n=1 Tax=Pistacia atlantica TaxID=434234 RepID=A0ACC1B3X7_9ROSI|nr:hypothetical protein Patl1_26296 [Pistacia atlantica]